MRIRKPLISAASVDHTSSLPVSACSAYRLVSLTIKLMRLSSKNSENRPRGSLGRGTLGPACLLHGVTLIGFALVDHAVTKLLLLLYYDIILLLLLIVPGSVTFSEGCDPPLWQLSLAILCLGKYIYVDLC